jgi:hypothetical protein
MARFETWRCNRPLHIYTGKRTSTDTACGVRSWPWQWFAPGKADRPLLLTSNWFIPIKSTLDWRVDAFCACKVIQLFSVVFYVVRAVHEFDCRLVIKETPNKWRPVERRSCSDRDSCFGQDLCFPPTIIAGVAVMFRSFIVSCFL